MGLTPTVVSARSSSARRNIFSCDTLSDTVLLAPGFPPAAGSRSNEISDGAVITVAKGQCAILVSRGKVFDLCAEPGNYSYDMGAVPAPIPGELGPEALRNLYPYPPDSAHKLYYVRTGDAKPLAFGNRQGLPFRIVLPEDRLDVDVILRFEGVFSYRVCDPALFFTNVTGNVTEPFDGGELNTLLRTQAETLLAPALARLAAAGTLFPSRQDFCRAIAADVTAQLEPHWRERFGLAPSGLELRYVSPDGEGGRFFERWLAAGQRAALTPEGAWTCPDCGAESTGNFCPQCGRKRPERSS